MQKYHILSAELYHSVKSIDEKLYMCKTCHKHLNKNEIPCQAVCSKWLYSISRDEWKNLKKLEKVLISKRVLFNKKKEIMHWKGEFSKN